MNTTKPKPFCFVLMPFDEIFDDVYNFGIKACCIENGAYCERVDEQIFDGTILDRIYNQIAKADFIIADMTGRNPNVFYEVGYAHALGKPTILLTQNVDDIPFDLKSYPHIIYESKILKLKPELSKRLVRFIENPTIKTSEYTIGIDLYYEKHSLSVPNQIIPIIAKEYVDGMSSDCIEAHLEFVLHNTSQIAYRSDEYKIALIMDFGFGVESTFINEAFKLPNEKLVRHLDLDYDFFPDSYQRFYFNLSWHNKMDIVKVLFKIYTSAGAREYYLNLQCSYETASKWK